MSGEKRNLRKRASALTVEQCEAVLAEAYQTLDRFDRLRILHDVVEDLTWHQRFASKQTAEAVIERQLLYYTILALNECLELAGETIERQHAQLGQKRQPGALRDLSGDLPA